MKNYFGNLIILFDCDGVWQDFNLGFDLWWPKIYHQPVPIPYTQRKTLWIRDSFPKTMRKKVERVYLRKGFYYDIPVVEEAVGAIKELIKEGFYIKFCTAPIKKSVYCYEERWRKIKDLFGEEIAERTVWAGDKTFIFGHIIFDDTILRGKMSPSWKQNLVTTRYNEDIETNLPRVNKDWKNWREVFNNRLKEIEMRGIREARCL